MTLIESKQYYDNSDPAKKDLEVAPVLNKKNTDNKPPLEKKEINFFLVWFATENYFVSEIGTFLEFNKPRINFLN